MKKTGKRAKRAKSVWVYVLGVAILGILFFTNDFGLSDIQKTAIVLAVGIDRTGDDFTVTSQIAVPSANTQGENSAEAMQVTTRGKTVAAAIQKVSEKTGWYPKLVFCKLIVLGSSTLAHDVFESLDYFLRNEYTSDDCLLCCCEKEAKSILEETVPFESVSSLAIEKLLSDHAAKVGLVSPSSLRSFAVGYFGESKSATMPLLKTVPLNQDESGGSGSSGSSESSGSSDNSDESGGGKEEAEGKSQGQDNAAKTGKTTYAASETAFFFGGRYVGTLTAEETFVYRLISDGVRLATLNVDYGGVTHTLFIKQGKAKIQFNVDDLSVPRLRIDVKADAKLQDLSASQSIVEIAAPENVRTEIFKAAEDKTLALLKSGFEKSRAQNCDLYGVKKRLQKFESRYYRAFGDDVLNRVTLHGSAKFFTSG